MLEKLGSKIDALFDETTDEIIEEPFEDHFEEIVEESAEPEIELNYHLDMPITANGFYVRGCNNVNYGMKTRLAKIFNPRSGNTVMLSFDYGFISGPIAGLERIDLAVPPLTEYVDCLLGTRGGMQACIPPEAGAARIIRLNYDATDLLSDITGGGGFTSDAVSAIALGADAFAVQCFIGAPGESRSLELLGRTADTGAKFGIPTLGVTGVGKEMECDENYILLATRVLAENGANIVKTCYCDGFEHIASTCPVPVIVTCGKKLPEYDLLETAFNAMQSGASGFDPGRNIFQSDCPEGLAKAIVGIVHDGLTSKEAFAVYEEMKK